jgi:SAM-dependent methyltransferase
VSELGSSRWQSTDAARGDAYDEKWRQMAAAGQDPHGEVAFVQRFEPNDVLDAGCGTGRVAIELDRRGIDVVGFDLDLSMLDTARQNAPHLQWVQADASTVDLGRRFDVVVMAGNVMIFVDPGTEAEVVARVAEHVAPGGRWITGFSLRPDRYGVNEMDAHAAAVGLELEHRFATWNGARFDDDADYAVSVYRSN